MRRLAQFIAAWEVPLLAALAPLLLFPQSTAGLAMLGVVALWLARWLAHGRLIRRTPLDVPILAILVMVLVSLLVTFDPALSMPKVVGVVLGVAVFYTMVEKMEDETAIWWGLALFIVLGCGVAMLGLIGTNWLPKFGPLAWLALKLPRTVILLPDSSDEGFHPNQVAGAMLWLCPLLIALLVVRPPALALLGMILPAPLTRALLATALTLTGGVLLLTQSRGGYVGVAISLAVLIWLLLPRTRLWLVAAGALVLVSLLVFRPLLTTSSQAGPEPAVLEASTESMAFRLEIWPQALEVIRDFPLTGIGMGAFRHVAQTWYRPLGFPAGREIGHAHNHVLNAALDLGLPGLAAYLGLWTTTIILAGIVIAGDRSAWRIISAGLLSGMIGHFIWGMVDANALGSKPGLLLWMCFAIVVSVYYYSRAVLQPESKHVSGNATIQPDHSP